MAYLELYYPKWVRCCGQVRKVLEGPEVKSFISTLFFSPSSPGNACVSSYKISSKSFLQRQPVPRSRLEDARVAGRDQADASRASCCRAGAARNANQQPRRLPGY